MKKLVLMAIILSSFSAKAQNWFSGGEGDQGGRVDVYTISSEASLGLSTLVSSSLFRIFLTDSLIEFRAERFRFMNNARTDSFELNFSKFQKLNVLGTILTPLRISQWDTAYAFRNTFLNQGFLTTQTAREAISLTETDELDFDLTALSYQDISIEVTGAEFGDVVSIGVPNVAVVSDVTYFGWVSATDVVSIRCSRVGGGGAANPASGEFRVSVFRY